MASATANQAAMTCLCSVPNIKHIINPLIATFKSQSNGPSYTNTVIGTLAVDGWAGTFGTARWGLGGAAACPDPPRCTKCNNTPINGQCTNFVLFAVALPLESKGLMT